MTKLNVVSLDRALKKSMREEAYSRVIEKATSQLCAGTITKMEWEWYCKEAWIDCNGPVPEGRELVVGTVHNRVVVGHVEKQEDVEPDEVAWRFARGY